MTKAKPTFSDDLLRDSMVSREALELLYRRARVAACRGDGTIVELGSYRGASTVALAMAVRDAGRGHVFAIDPHEQRTGILGGAFCERDHDIFLGNIAAHGLSDFVTHVCAESGSAVESWQRDIEMLWIDADHSYDGVRMDLTAWTGFLKPGGVLVLDDHTAGSEVEAATNDHLSYAFYLPVERNKDVLVFERLAEGRTMFLCGGMQSSGSTLVSMCFLQRPELDGLYDMDNPFIQHGFANVPTSQCWVKMTIGSFRLKELHDVYTAQGWNVKPLLVARDPVDIIASLSGKQYGNDGCTGDDPPLLTRLQRYLADLDHARTKDWPVLDYERLVADPEAELRMACARLEMPWSDAMLEWPKDLDDFAYPSVGSPSLRSTISRGTGLLGAVENYLACKRSTASSPIASLIVSVAIEDDFKAVRKTLPPSKYRGTRRQVLESELQSAKRELSQLRGDCTRIADHPVIGRFLRCWRFAVNSKLPTLR